MKSGRYSDYGGESIILRQFCEGIAQGLSIEEAAETLLKNSTLWDLPSDEIALVKQRLEFFKTELKNLGYEG